MKLSVDENTLVKDGIIYEAHLATRDCEVCELFQQCSKHGMRDYSYMCWARWRNDNRNIIWKIVNKEFGSWL